MLGVVDRSIKVAHRWDPVGHEENVGAMLRQLPDLLDSPVVVPVENLNQIKLQLSRHFDAMAEALVGGGKRDE
jgi:hypothetical protein